MLYCLLKTQIIIDNNIYYIKTSTLLQITIIDQIIT